MQLRPRISAHPTVAFFLLAFTMSWTLMAPAMVAGLDSFAAVPFFLGVWAPAAAAAIVVRITGGSIRGWPCHSCSSAFCLLVNGRPEEPAWRGFALPRLQAQLSPVKATLLAAA